MDDEWDDDEPLDIPPERYYTNFARWYATRYDLTIDLGYHVTPAEPVDWQARVSMSWEEARVLRDLLVEAINAQDRAGPSSGNGGRRGTDEDLDDNTDPDK
jgi:hypothetical protein